MDATLLASLIGGTCTIVAPIITLVVKGTLERLRHVAIPLSRQRSLRGTWTGTVSYDSPSELTRHSVRTEFSATKRIVRGRATYRSDGGDASLCFKGSFISDRFMQGEYTNEAEQVINFGTILFELSADARSLKGKFVGYGRVTEDIVTGNINLEKEPA